MNVKIRCVHRYHKRRDVDEAVWAAIYDPLREDDSTWARRLQGDGEDEATVAAKRTALERQVAELRGARERVPTLVVRSVIGPDEAERALRDSAAQLQRAQAALRPLVAGEEARRAEAQRLLADLQRLRAEAEAAATPEARRAVARRLLREVYLYPDGRVELVPKVGRSAQELMPS